MHPLSTVELPEASVDELTGGLLTPSPKERVFEQCFS